jgi:hypothetical protein
MPQIQETNDYQEKVLPGLWFYAATLVLPLSFLLIALPFGEQIAVVSALASLFLAWGFSWAVAPKIQISRQFLRVGKASIDRDFLGKASVITPSESFAARGPNLEMNAYSVFQPSVKGLVRVELKDKADPCPYWIFSTRNPEIVAALLNRN